MARLVIEPVNLHWVYDAEPTDLCVHGGFQVTLDGELIFKAGVEDDGFTLSTAALHLLRTVTRDYDPAQSESGQLFPCCGNMMVFNEERAEVVNVPCPNGIDWIVRHDVEDVTVHISDALTFAITCAQWAAAVHAFSSSVRSFYFTSPERVVDNEDDASWHPKFIDEWSFLHFAAAG